MSPPSRRGGSLRRTLLLWSVTLAGALVAGVGGVMWVESTLRAELYAATDAFVEEQRIADAIGRAVSRQMMAASLFAMHGTPDLMGEVRKAGDEAYALIRTYLFRDLTPAQRLKLEAVKEAHERLEAATGRLLLRDPDSVRALRTDSTPLRIVGDAAALQTALDDFLELRESDVEELRHRQATVFRGLHAAGAGLALLLLGVAIPFAGFLHGRLVGPLESLADTARRIEEGDLSARVEPGHDDELARVGEGFNTMVDTLLDARSRLEGKNRELERAMGKLRETQAELVQTEKLSAVGEMMAGLAHELNNPLASVLGYGHLLEEELRSAAAASLPEIRRSCVQPLVEEAERARELVRSLLRFSRRSDGALVPVSLRQTMRTVERLRVYSFEQAGLALEIGELPDVRVVAEVQGLQQVFLNLVNNAFDAMEARGHGTLRVGARLADRRVEVSFVDDGPGFPDPERALEPFFTTKPPGKGTGLGLSLVHRFVGHFGGSVLVVNEPSGGARVRLRLRLADAEAPASGDGDPTGRADGRFSDGGRASDAGSAVILVVEDEQPLRALQERLLRRLNARVITAPSGAEARNILQDRDVDLVISDVKMPGALTGLDLFRWVQAERPSLAQRFLFVTGDTEDSELSEFSARHPGRLLEKPFQVQDYVRRVLDLLEGAP